MEEKKEKSLFSEIVFVALVGAVTTLVVFATNYPNHRENARLLKKQTALVERVKGLEKEQAFLLKEKTALREDPMYVEWWLRKKCDLKRPGEILYPREGE